MTDKETLLEYGDDLQRAAECLKVMAHPQRLMIAELLANDELPVKDIAEACELAPNRACEHLRLMQRHGLLNSERRGRSVYYSVASQTLVRLVECVKLKCGLVDRERTV